MPTPKNNLAATMKVIWTAEHSAVFSQHKSADRLELTSQPAKQPGRHGTAEPKGDEILILFYQY